MGIYFLKQKYYLKYFYGKIKKKYLKNYLKVKSISFYVFFTITTLVI